DSSSLMKLEDEARYVLLPVIHRAATPSLSPLFSLPLHVAQRLHRGTNQSTQSCDGLQGHSFGPALLSGLEFPVAPPTGTRAKGPWLSITVIRK
ncbi:hypothetical protein KUCAC02_006288, partial [Chaenocephalus aceratus]